VTSKPVRAPREDLALVPSAVMSLLAPAVQERLGFRPSTCELHVLKRRPRRVVVRYELRGEGSGASVVGKWFHDDRGADVADALSRLREHEFDGREVYVPMPILYARYARALFTEAVDGRLLRDALLGDEAVAGRAGAWLAAFHAANVALARDCGPERQRRDAASWAAKQPAIATLAGRVDNALRKAPDPARPVHYDYYHAQALIDGNGRIVVVDFDQAGTGDPAFDLAHFEALLAVLARRELGDPERLRGAREAFRAGYAARAAMPNRDPAVEAFTWLKLAYVATARRDAGEQEYTRRRVEDALAAA
jgi:aminoglycoside phosphotransferase (APT) family kinase protein